jgi:hypothetical protein
VVLSATTGVRGEPILIQIETGPLGAFPSPIRINALELYLTKGVGRAVGVDPLETDPDISISISRDGGQTGACRASSRLAAVAHRRRVRAAIWGQAQNQGVRWRLRESAPLSFAFMGADMLTDVLR